MRRRFAVLAVAALVSFAGLAILVATPIDPPAANRNSSSFGDNVSQSAAPALPDWIGDALCEAACDELLTMRELTSTLSELEASVGPSAIRQHRLVGLGFSICPHGCPDRFVTRSQVELIMWRWLGSPGWPLVGTGHVASDQAMASAYFAHVVPDASLGCAETCEAQAADLRQAVTRSSFTVNSRA